MPQIIYIRPPASPVRKFPNGVSMNSIEPSPYRHKTCGKAAKFYADGVIWCEHCEHKVNADDCVDLRRHKL